MPVPNFDQILKRIEEIHNRKNKDYSTNEDAFSNFEQAAVIASWVNDPVLKVFFTLIGVKLSRLANLVNKGGVPNNESLDDTLLDNDTYSILMHAYWLSKPMDNKSK